MGNAKSILSPVLKSRKRHLEHDSSNNSESTPPSKRFCPEDTIYEQCFIHGMGHDIVVRISGKEWKLHKESLVKSPYFASMFSGSWNESSKKVIDITIPNPIITETSLNIVLGSLYHHNVSFSQEDVLGVIAAASLFQLDELIKHCEDMLLSNICIENVLTYNDVAQEYSLHRVFKGSLTFLLANLVCFYPSNVKQLSQINCKLMHKLISSPELVTTSPMDVYRLLRLWLYLKINPHTTEDKVFRQTEVRQFFFDQQSAKAFLDTPNGQIYRDIFHSLELYTILTASWNISEVQEDNIIPKSWVCSVYEKLWRVISQTMYEEKCPYLAEQVSSSENSNSVHQDFECILRENTISRNSFKWSTVLPATEFCISDIRQSWLTFNLSSFGLVSEWKFTGAMLQVRFTPDRLVENNIHFVPMYCRFSIFAMNIKNQILKYTSKGVYRLLQRHQIEDLLKFDRSNYAHDDAVLYLIALNVFIGHRLALTKILSELNTGKTGSTLEEKYTEKILPSTPSPLRPVEDEQEEEELNQYLNELEEDEDDIQGEGEGEEEEGENEDENEGEEEDEGYIDGEIRHILNERNSVAGVEPGTRHILDTRMLSKSYSEYKDDLFIHLYIPSNLHSSGTR